MLSAVRCEHPEWLITPFHFSVRFLFCLCLLFLKLLLSLPLVAIKAFVRYFLQPHTDPPAPGAEADPALPELARGWVLCRAWLGSSLQWDLYDLSVEHQSLEVFSQAHLL